jgi:peptide/nickel transport system permease protein
VIVLVNLAVAAFAPIIAGQNPNFIPTGSCVVLTNTTIINNCLFEKPSPNHLLGTDDLGRDEFSRIIYGTQVAFTVGILSTLAAAAIGIVLGTTAGWYKGRVDRIIQGFVDVWLSLPTLVLSIILVAFLGAGIQNTVFAIAVGYAPYFARVIRAEVIRVSERDFVSAQALLGFGSFRTIFRNVLPNTLTTLVVLFSYYLASALLAEASLEFLGLGVKPPTPSWGLILNELAPFFSTQLWTAFPPGIAIAQLVLGFNFLGDGIRDAFDPRLRV